MITLKQVCGTSLRKTWWCVNTSNLQYYGECTKHSLHTNIQLTRKLSTKSAVEPLESNGKKTNKQSDRNMDKGHQREPQSYSQPTGTPTKSTLVGMDEKLLVFHQPSKNLLNVNLASGQQNVSLFFKKTEELVSMDFNKLSAKQEYLRKELDSGEVEVESMEDVMWNEVKVDTSKLHAYYLKLAKIRLTGLVVITTMAGYAMAPGPFIPLTFLCCTIGTGLTSSAANAINQYLEVPFDSQMNRTKNRPIVMGAITPLHAVTFAAVTAGSGLTILCLGANPLTAGLGLTNLLLYTMAYTPMKRLTIANTWVGSVVGAIPPMMGWVACTGALEPGAWLLGAILFAWQFPHFNALSWNLRPDYSRAGYRMMSVIDPDLCKRTTLRYSLGLIGLCTLAPVCDVTTWAFAFDSFPLNAYMTYLAYKFYKEGDSNSSRKLFRFSLFHIPALLILMLISKKPYGEQKKTLAEPKFKISNLHHS